MNFWPARGLNWEFVFTRERLVSLMVAKCFGIMLTFVRHHRVGIVIRMSINFEAFLILFARSELVDCPRSRPLLSYFLRFV